VSTTVTRRPAPAPGDERFGREVTRVVLAFATVVAVVAAVVAVVVLRSAGTSDTGAVPAGSSVAVIGDSYTTGTVLGGLGGLNWTARLGVDRSWSMTDTAIGGTGYVQTHGSDGAFQAAQLDRAVTADPAMVIVAGSINDGLVAPERVGAAASALYAAVRARAPQARLVVVGPPWPSGTPTAEILRIRDALAAAARTSGALWIDPLAEGWFTDPVGLIGADGVHPTDAGHALIAHRIGLDLHAAGL
jgi:lysophospholipase L1-like esterase